MIHHQRSGIEVEELSENEMIKNVAARNQTEIGGSIISQGSFFGDEEDDEPATNLGVYQKVSVQSKPKKSLLLTERSLTIEELQKLHENLTIALYHEPTNENRPYRP